MFQNWSGVLAIAVLLDEAVLEADSGGFRTAHNATDLSISMSAAPMYLPSFFLPLHHHCQGHSVQCAVAWRPSPLLLCLALVCLYIYSYRLLLS